MNLLDLFVKISVDTSEVDKTLGDTKEKALSFGDVLKANIAGQAIVAGVKAVAGAVKTLAKQRSKATGSMSSWSAAWKRFSSPLPIP